MGRYRQFEFTSVRPPFSALHVRSARVGGDAQRPTGTVRSAASLSYAHPRVIVVSGYKVNARPRFAAPFVKQIGGTSQARSHFSRFSFIALQTLLTVSRKRSFHSAHPGGNDPTWYPPGPQSHGSAMSFTLLRTGSCPQLSK